MTDLLDYKQPGILGETFVRCEPVDPDDRVTCAFSGAEPGHGDAYRDGNETVIPTAGTGVLNPGDRFSFYVIMKVDAGYVLDADGLRGVERGAHRDDDDATSVGRTTATRS